MSGSEIFDGPLATDRANDAILTGQNYWSVDDFKAEQSSIFSRGWAWAGFTHWLPANGSVHPITIGGQPLMLVKDAEGQIRAFHNSCRHRGMALFTEPTTVKKRMQCEYHCWTYNLDGSLATAPHYRRQRRTFATEDELSRMGLIEVSCQVWAQNVFVSLDPAVESLGSYLEPIQQRWKHYDLDNLLLVEERKYEVPANWKLIVENFLDFYHLPFIHPQVGPLDASLNVDDVVLSANIVGGQYPSGAASKATKTDDALPTLGTVPTELFAAQDIFAIFPNTLVFVESDWYQIIGLEPIAPNQTREHMAVYVAGNADGERWSSERKKLAETLFNVNDQDLPILAKLQMGHHSSARDQAQLVPYWDQVTAAFQRRVRAAGATVQPAETAAST